jgi:hypothetical protein
MRDPRYVLSNGSPFVLALLRGVGVPASANTTRAELIASDKETMNLVVTIPVTREALNAAAAAQLEAP